MLDVSSLFQYLVNQIIETKGRQPILSVYILFIITLFEPKRGHTQLSIMRLLAFPYTERPEHVIKKTVIYIVVIHEYIKNFV